MSGAVQPLYHVRGGTWFRNGANVRWGSDATPEIGAGVFIAVGLLGPRLNLRRHVPSEAVDNGAAERTLTDSAQKRLLGRREDTHRDRIWPLEVLVH